MASPRGRRGPPPPPPPPDPGDFPPPPEEDGGEAESAATVEEMEEEGDAKGFGLSLMYLPELCGEENQETKLSVSERQSYPLRVIM